MIVVTYSLQPAAKMNIHKVNAGKIIEWNVMPSMLLEHVFGAKAIWKWSIMNDRVKTDITSIPHFTTASATSSGSLCSQMIYTIRTTTSQIQLIMTTTSNLARTVTFSLRKIRCRL